MIVHIGLCALCSVTCPKFGHLQVRKVKILIFVRNNNFVKIVNELLVRMFFCSIPTEATNSILSAQFQNSEAGCPNLEVHATLYTATRPDKLGYVFQISCIKVTCPVYATVLAYTRQVIFYKVPCHPVA